MAERSERWDRDRYVYERDRDRQGDDRREFFEERDRGYSRNVGGRGGPPPGPPRDRSVDRYERRANDDDYVRDRRFYEDDRPPARWGGPGPAMRRQSPPPQRDYDRRVVIEKEREVVRDDSPPPGPRRPAFLRRQSSLDTFDRRPPARFRDRVVEYGPPARRDDYRPPTGVPIPLPRAKGLPAPGPGPRRFEREYYDEIKVTDPEFYGDDDFHPYPERIREREVVRTSRRRDNNHHHHRERDRSADSRTSRTSRSTRATSRSRRARSRSSGSESSASSSSGTRSVATTTLTARSEYPKKGKTRMPTRLVSRRALIELGYPFIEEGNTTIILKALGQNNIDELLKLSEEYKRIELETEAARSPPRLVEERREYERREVDFVEPVGPPAWAPPPPPPPPPGHMHGGPAPVIVDAAPPVTTEIIDRKTVIREISPARSASTSAYIVDREVSDEMTVGPLVLAERPRSRSRSRNRRDIRAEIKELERELKHGRTGSRDLVRAERLPTGEVVLYEEKVEKVEEGYRGVRIEKDKRGPPPKIVRAMLATLT